MCTESRQGSRPEGSSLFVYALSGRSRRATLHFVLLISLFDWMSYFFFFFNRRYNPWWVLACFTISFHNLLSLHFSLQFLTFFFFKSSSTWSNHLSLGLSTSLDEHGSHSVTFLTILVVSILITCAAHRNECHTWWLIVTVSLTTYLDNLTHSLNSLCLIST